jgi:hypothetical protein
MLGGYTLLCLITIPAISNYPHSLPAFPFARITFAIGAVTWVAMFFACIHAFCFPAERPSFVASFTFFMLLCVEIAIVANVL